MVTSGSFGIVPVRHFEFWHPRFFETPYYLYLLMKCLGNLLPPTDLAKANYALEHGELGLGSKFNTQMAFQQDYFLPTILLEPDSPVALRVQAAEDFAARCGYPLIAKPDIGAVGKGVVKISSSEELASFARSLNLAHLLQEFSPHSEEFGVFFVRHQGVGQITGINRKHFPEVTGNGVASVKQLAMAHERYSDHWGIFLRYLDTERVLPSGEKLRLSFIGSHTMGCKFTDDSRLATPALKEAINSICDSQPGFNFGRLDVKAESQAAFESGDFVVIEINGVASLPTHMFDPKHTLLDAYRTFFRHGRYLVAIAKEHRRQEMELDSLWSILQLARSNAAKLDRAHDAAIQGHQGHQGHQE